MGGVPASSTVAPVGGGDGQSSPRPPQLPLSISSTFAQERRQTPTTVTSSRLLQGNRVKVPLVGSTGDTPSMAAQRSCLANASAFYAATSPYQDDESRRRHTSSTSVSRKPQICRTCGHAKQAPEWKALHVFNQSSSHCKVPEDSRRDGYPLAGKSSHAAYNACSCARCAGFLRSKGIVLD